MILSLFLILFGGIAVGTAFGRLHIPALIGYLALGLALGAAGILDGSLLAVSADLRRVALVVILLRAGLSTRFSELKKSGTRGEDGKGGMGDRGDLPVYPCGRGGVPVRAVEQSRAERAFASLQPRGALSRRAREHAWDEVYRKGTRILYAFLSAQGDGAGGDRGNRAFGRPGVRGDRAVGCRRRDHSHRADRRGGDRAERKEIALACAM